MASCHVLDEKLESGIKQLNTLFTHIQELNPHNIDYVHEIYNFFIDINIQIKEIKRISEGLAKGFIKLEDELNNEINLLKKQKNVSQEIEHNFRSWLS